MWNDGRHRHRRAGRYGEAMTTRLARVKQVILLFALALCVVAMHHIGMAENASASPMPSAPTMQLETSPPAAPGDEHPDMPSDAHGLPHLRLAVLSAVGAARSEVRRVGQEVRS